MGQDDFDIIKTVGKGSFGRVFMVKKKDTKRVYAMKVLKKEKVIARNQLQHSFLASVAGVGGVFPVSVFPVWVLCFRSLGCRAYVVFDSFQGTRG